MINPTGSENMKAQQNFKGIVRRSTKTGRPVKGARKTVANKKHARRRNKSPYQKFVALHMKPGVTMKDVGAMWRKGHHAANPANKKRKSPRKKNSWGGHPAAHAKASKKGWHNRKAGKKGYAPAKFRARNPANKKKYHKSKMFRFRNPLKKLGSIKKYIVPIKWADIKAQPIPHVVGGAIGFGTSTMTAGVMRRAVAGKFGGPAGDVASFAGNVIGTEVPAIIVKWIGTKAKQDRLCTAMARGVRVGGYISLGINAVATVIKYLTGKGSGFGAPVLPMFKEGQYLMGAKELGMSGLNVAGLLPGQSDDIEALAALYGLSVDDMNALAAESNMSIGEYANALSKVDTPTDYNGLGDTPSNYASLEASLDAEIESLQQELGAGEAPEAMGSQDMDLQDIEG